MENFWKMVSTGFIWVVVGAIIISGMYADSNSNLDITAIALAALIAGAIGTFMIWIGSGLIAADIAKSQHETLNGGETEKTKRDALSTDPETAKLHLLMEMMDDDELFAFKEALKQRVLDSAHVTDDGELAYYDASLNQLTDDAYR